MSVRASLISQRQQQHQQQQQQKQRQLKATEKNVAAAARAIRQRISEAASQASQPVWLVSRKLTLHTHRHTRIYVSTLSPEKIKQRCKNANKATIT